MHLALLTRCVPKCIAAVDVKSKCLTGKQFTGKDFVNKNFANMSFREKNLSSKNFSSKGFREKSCTENSLMEHSLVEKSAAVKYLARKLVVHADSQNTNVAFGNEFLCWLLAQCFSVLSIISHFTGLIIQNLVDLNVKKIPYGKNLAATYPI